MDFTELLNALLVHILPGHLSQVGSFLEEMIFKDNSAFKENLEVYMNHRKIQMDQIYNLLNQLAEESAVEMMVIKQRFLVVLQNNPFMEAWFLQLFPAERASQDNVSMQFWRYGSRVILPLDIMKYLAKIEEEERNVPNLFLSDSEGENANDDSIECMDVEPEPEKAVNCYSVHSQDSWDADKSFTKNHVYGVYASRGELDSSTMDSSAMFTDVTDYTE